MRTSRIANELEEVRAASFLEVIECAPKGITRTDKWVLWVPGKQHTPWDGANIPVVITFPADYPRSAPLIQFEGEFKHVHVYKGGSICMPLLEQAYWKAKTTMVDIIQRVYTLLHQEINPYSPANSDLFRLSQEHPE